MVRISFVEADGRRVAVDAHPGQTVMEAAVKNGIAGIVAECGGNCVCGTCRIYPEPAWADRLGAVSAIEADMLDFREDGRAGVRLACRIAVHGGLEGLTVHLPDSQR